MNSLKNKFNLKNLKSNSFICKNGKINSEPKLKKTKIEAMYDKVKNHFQSYEFIKLQLLGEDNSNYGDLCIKGYIYKPKNIKVEYLGNKKINSELLPDKDFSYKNSFFINKNKIKKISFVSPIYFRKGKKHNNSNILDKNNYSYLENKLPLINRINSSVYKDNKNKNSRNFNSMSFDNSSVTKNIIQNKYNSEIKITNRNNSNKANFNKIIFNKKNSINKLLKKKNIYNLKKQLKNKIDLLENKVNNSSNFILNGSKINEEEKPQFKFRFNNLDLHFKNFLS